MKVGDKVRLVKIFSIDEEETNLKIGAIGTLICDHWLNDGSKADVFEVVFKNIEVAEGCENYDLETGRYTVYREQIEKVQED